MYKTWKDNQRRLSASVSLSIVILVVGVSTTQLTSMVTLNGNPIAFNDVYAKYSNNQAQSFVNECGLNGVTGINCANNGPLMQGDGLASSPIVTQSGGRQGEQGPPEPPREVARLTVIKLVFCEGVGAAECPAPSDFTMTVEGANPSEPTFPGSDTPGTTINIDANTQYSVGELEEIKNLDPDAELEDTTFSAECSGTVAIDNTETCTVTNFIGPN